MVQLATGLEDDGEQDKQAPITLGSLSILLLLNLACHHPARGTNPFKETSAAFQNSQGTVASILYLLSYSLRSFLPFHRNFNV